MDGDKQAFPGSNEWGYHSGMTYREYIAAHVLAALAPTYASDNAVRSAISYADKLIKQLNEEKSQ